MTFQRRQYKCKAYLQPGHGKDVLRGDQHHVQPHHLHSVPGKTPPSATVQQPPKSPPATSHCLCPTVTLTAALAQHRKAQVAPALGNDHGLPWCALPASETRWPTETCWVGPERASTLVPFPTYSLDSIVEEL